MSSFSLYTQNTAKNTDVWFLSAGICCVEMLSQGRTKFSIFSGLDFSKLQRTNRCHVSLCGSKGKEDPVMFCFSHLSQNNGLRICFQILDILWIQLLKSYELSDVLTKTVTPPRMCSSSLRTQKDYAQIDVWSLSRFLISKSSKSFLESASKNQ